MKISGIHYVSRRTHGFRRFLIALIFLLFLIILMVAFVSAYIGWNLIRPEKVSIEPFSSNIVLEYRDVSFNSKNKDVVLNGWFFEAKGNVRTVILAHEYGKNRLQFGDKTLDIIKNFISKGYNVLAFDFRNSGKSGGTISSFGIYEKNDVLGAVEYVKSQGASDIILMGFSTGASACILAASESNDVDAVIADTPYSNLNTYLDRFVSGWTRLPAIPFNTTISYSIMVLSGIHNEKVDPEDAIPHLSPRPILMIHSINDSIIPIDSSEALYSSYSKLQKGNVELWKTNVAGHAASYLQSSPEYMEKVLGFLDRAFKKS